MAKDFGSGVSRTLSAKERAFNTVIFQKKRPPLDSELNLAQQVDLERFADHVRSHMHSGFLTDPVRTLNDFSTDPDWSNLLVFGDTESGEKEPVIWANVNGWLIPVAGTAVTSSGDLKNFIKLNPPPSSGTRVDFVFLEAWSAIVNPNPSTTNKPSADKIWKYGNVEFGDTNIDDDLTDPTIGYETTKRVQVQYRLRVFGEGNGAGSSVALDIYPDGLEDPNIYGQGTFSSPVSGFNFENMREELGDPSLWRAGDGDPNNSLGTVDGYTYAIPVCAIFRRNSSTFVAVTDSGTPNQNGSFNRNPSASLLSNPRDGAKMLTIATLDADITDTQTGIITVNDLAGSGLSDPELNGGSGVDSANPLFVKINDEILKVINVDDTVSPGELTIDATDGRGRYATHATNHSSGSEVRFYNVRPDGLFADEIHEDDVLDLRRSITTDEWDYTELLLSNLGALLRGELKTAYKQSGGGTTQGVSVWEVGYMHADGSTSAPNATEAVDGPDGIRTVFSDAATIQPDVTVLCDDSAALVGGFTSTTFDQTVGWDVGADFKPSGFMNNLGSNGWTNGSSVFLYLGGEDGESGARATFRASGTREVRFVSPREFWKSGFPDADPENGRQDPFTLRFLGERSMEPGAEGSNSEDHPGPMYPLQSESFERPFIVLGGLLNSSLVVNGLSASTDLVNPSVDTFEVDLGIDFDVFGSFFPDDGSGNRAQAVEIDDPSSVTYPLLRGEKTLFDMLTDGGSDRTGLSSDVYLLLYGDTNSTVNNGAFQVIGAGNLTPYTLNSASNSTSIVVRPLSYGITIEEEGNGTWDTGSGGTLTAQLRSQVMNAEDGGAFTSGPSAASSVVVMTDLAGFSGTTDNPWYLYTEYDSTSFSLTPVPDGATFGPFSVSVPGITAATPLVPESLEITVSIGSPGSLETVVDDGVGGLSSPSFPGIIDTGLSSVNYNTGSISITFQGVGNEPTSGEDVFISYLAERAGVEYIDPPLNQKLLLNTSLLYHSGRGATARVPEDIWRVSLRNGDSSYLRQAPGLIDTDFNSETGAPSNETFYDSVHIQLWNRLPSLGLNAPNAPSFGGRIVAQSEQDRNHECFKDAGSKTIVFRPFQNKSMVLYGFDTEATPSLLGDLTFPSGDAKDPAGIWTTNKVLGYPVPPEFVPRFGRQDIPYRVDLDSGTGEFLEGINHLFTDSTTNGDTQHKIIGGEDNGGSPGINRILFQTGDVGLTGLTYSQRGTIIGPGDDVIQARKQSLSDVLSSDLGATLDGVELPPYYGVARVYGVYERSNFIAKGGLTFEDDRVTLKGDPPTNLLRRDADQQTLFIREDGASDFTTAAGDDPETGDHTYIIPEEALDLTKISGWTSSSEFSDFDYVVECSVFGFAKGFITKNNFVLARLHDGAGNTLSESTDTGEISNVQMTIPTPAKLNDPVYVGFTRVPYQGDPYMTRDGSTLVPSDYEPRYGTLNVGDALDVATPLPQVDSSGASLIETPNSRSLEVLASVDFFTTLGTGKIGGAFYPGTLLDVAHYVNNVRAASKIPENSSDPSFRFQARTFSEGQKENSSRASLEIEILSDSSQLDDSTVTITTLNDVDVQMIFKDSASYSSGTPEHVERTGTLEDIASNLAERINAHPSLVRTVTAKSGSSSFITLTSVPVGTEANGINVKIEPGSSFDIQTLMRLNVARGNDVNFNGVVTSSTLRGGEDLIVNAGNGTTQIELTGITERLPLGILLQDSDFLGENPLNDGASAFKTSPSGIRPVQTLLPLTRGGGEEYSRFLNEPGSLISMSDGAILAYSAHPAGVQKFRLYRGGGSVFLLSGKNPGGPIDWASDSFPASVKPVLKGGLLTCKALLVRNFHERAFSSNTKRSDGDELQMVILTYGILGDGKEQEEGILLNGEISPTGYGEGYAAADRYRLQGYPMYHGRSRTTPEVSEVTLAPFTGIVVEDEDEDC